MIEFKAPQTYTLELPSVFLAGSIEEGTAEDWQSKVVEHLKDLDVLILNPRREHWDASWKQEATNLQFVEQVTWELDALEKAHIIFFYFVPGTKSPISMLELGLMKDKQVVVCCPEGFWKRGNIEMVCQRYHIPFFNSIDKALKETITMLHSYESIRT